MKPAVSMYNAAIAGTGTAVSSVHTHENKIAFQGVITGTGVVAATVAIKGSIDGTNYGNTPLMTFTLSGTTTFNEIGQADSTYRYYQAVVSAVSGTVSSIRVWACGSVTN